MRERATMGRRMRKQRRTSERDEKRRWRQEQYDAMTSEQRKRAAKALAFAATAVAVVVLIVAISGGGDGNDETSSNHVASVTQPSMSAPQQKATHQRSQHRHSTPNGPAKLAASVKADVLANLMVKSFQQTCGTDAEWACAISGVKGISDGTVEVTIQEKLSRGEAKDVAHKVMTLSCMSSPGLQWVVVSDTSGGAVAQVKRSDAAPVCSA